MDASSLLARVRAGTQRLGCAPSEVAALAVLVSGAVVLLVLLWMRTPAAGIADDAGPVAPVDAHEAPVAGGDLAVTQRALVVHVTGAVASPGLYELAAGSRVADAVEAAGGATPDAALEAVNLARELTDGEQLVVLDRASAQAAEGGTASGAVGSDGRVNLNRATAQELETLPGVGPVTAQRIVDHREAHGPFARASDLMDVSGIGEKRFEALSELVGI